MGLLATLKVMLGVDSVEFQRKMKESADHVSVFENNFGKRTSMVERHGLRLVQTAQSVTSSIERMRVDGVGAVSQLAEAGGFVKLGIVLALAKLAIDAVNGAVKALVRDSMTAGKPLSEMVEGFVANQEAIDNLVGQVDLFAKRLGTSAEALGVTNVATKENVAGLLGLRDALEKEAIARRNSSEGYKIFLVQQKLAGERTAEQNKLHAQAVAMLDANREAQVRFNAAHGQYVPIGAQVAIALAAGAQKMREFAEEARRSAGVMNAEDIRAKAEALQKQVVAIAQSGGSASQTVAKLGDDFKTVVEVAKELGVELTPQFERAAEAIAQGPGLAMDDLFASFRGLPKEVDAARAASAASLAKMGKDLEGAVSGGFGRGAEEGVSFAEQQVDAWRQRLEATPIKLKFDASDLQRIIDAVTSGRMPTTTGSAP